MTRTVYKVVEAFQKRAWTARELADELECDYSSVSRIIERLVSMELIAEKRRAPRISNKGRTAIVYQWVKR